MIEDEDLLIEVLNSAPIRNGQKLDLLEGEAGTGLLARHGGAGTPAELRSVREMRHCLQDAIRNEPGAVTGLQRALTGVGLVPSVDDDCKSITWVLRAPEDGLLAARVALAWSRVVESLPGRLRPCANDECNLYLIDRSRPGTAKWCSMATCGNRMKARAHAERRQQRYGDVDPPTSPRDRG